jgi:SAM-dependent methyltransferase
LPAGIAFHEGIAAGWTRGYARGSFGRRRTCFLPILDRNVVPGRRWMDLGCGSGVLTRELLHRGADVLAVDGSPAMLREAEALVGDTYGSAVRWARGSAEYLPQVADGWLDGVLCSSVVEYVERPDHLLDEIARVLRPGGTLILSCPPARSAVRTAQKALRTLWRYAGHDPYPYLDVSRFEIDPCAVAQWLQQAGLVLDRTTAFDPLLPAPMLRLLRPSLLVLEAHKSALYTGMVASLPFRS